MTTEQIITVGIVVALLMAVISQGISIYRKDTQHANLITIVADVAQQIGSNPVWIENAKAVGQSVPQQVFNSVITRMDALEEFLGQQSDIGITLQRVEDVIRRIDRDPANDPKLPAIIGYGDSANGTTFTMSNTGQPPADTVHVPEPPVS